VNPCSGLCLAGRAWRRKLTSALRRGPSARAAWMMCPKTTTWSTGRAQVRRGRQKCRVSEHSCAFPNPETKGWALQHGEEMQIVS
jgi:hypothetical protein